MSFELGIIDLESDLRDNNTAYLIYIAGSAILSLFLFNILIAILIKNYENITSNKVLIGYRAKIEDILLVSVYAKF